MKKMKKIDIKEIMENIKQAKSQKKKSVKIP